MFFDLNLTISKLPSTGNASKKTKEQQGEQSVVYGAPEIVAIEKRLDLLIHCSFHNAVIFRELNVFFSSRIHCHCLLADGKKTCRRQDAYKHIEFSY